MQTEAKEGKLAVEGGRIWYRVTGQGAGPPIVIIHGGPGMTHFYLENLDALSDEWPVVQYDQLGSGLSDRPTDTRLWTIDRFTRELITLIEALTEGPVHLLGQSWGTILALECALARPDLVRSIVMASPAISVPRFAADAQRLRNTLPDDLRAALDRHEAAGSFEAPEYEEAVMEFYKRYVCRMWPFPDEMRRNREHAGFDVYNHMWGPNEFTPAPTATVKEYDGTLRLGELTMPVLYVCGRYDECTPEASRAYHDQTPGSRLVVFERSAHMAHLEEPAAFLGTIREFLRTT